MAVLVHRMFDPMLWVILGWGVLVWKLRDSGGSALLWRRLLAALWCFALVLSLPATASLTLGSLERFHAPVSSRPTDVDCIAVPGGGCMPAVEGSPASRLTDASTRRCLRAVEMYRDGPPCPIVLCGGIVRPWETDVSEAAVMRDFVLALGVPSEDILLEESSRNTFENSVGSRDVMERHGLRKAALVTDASHLPRATALYRAQGIDVVPVGCGYERRSQPLSYLSFIPDSKSPLANYDAVHEALGLVSFWVRGR